MSNYLVNGKCLSNFSEAIDLYYSSIAPVIQNDQIVAPKKINDKWYLFNQVLPTDILPDCNFTAFDQYKDSLQLFWIFFTVLISIWALKQIYNLFAKDGHVY